MDYAVGVLELRSIARGIEASDAALKSAGIRLISAQPICPGKFELVITGELAQVNAAMDRVKAGFEENLLDAVLLGRIDPAVVKALLGAQPEAKRGALGTIETFTVASVILAADCAVKSADVEILELRTARGMGGKGVVLLTGDVADVTAAVEAGARYAKEPGRVRGPVDPRRAPRGALEFPVKASAKEASGQRPDASFFHAAEFLFRRLGHHRVDGRGHVERDRAGRPCSESQASRSASSVSRRA